MFTNGLCLTLLPSSSTAAPRFSGRVGLVSAFAFVIICLSGGLAGSAFTERSSFTTACSFRLVETCRDGAALLPLCEVSSGIILLNGKGKAAHITLNVFIAHSSSPAANPLANTSSTHSFLITRTSVLCVCVSYSANLSMTESRSVQSTSVSGSCSNPDGTRWV